MIDEKGFVIRNVTRGIVMLASPRLVREDTNQGFKNQLSSLLFDMFRRACRMIDNKGFVIRNVTRWIVMLVSARDEKGFVILSPMVRVLTNQLSFSFSSGIFLCLRAAD
jgi:hypothetical protein